MLIKYTIQITNSHTEVTSPRSGGTKAAQKLILHFIRIRHCDRLFWCDWKQILTRCSYKKLWKPTASTLSLRHGRTTKPKRTAKPWRETWGSPCHLYQLRSTWQWAALEVEAQQAACFWINMFLDLPKQPRNRSRILSYYLFIRLNDTILSSY